MTIEREFRGIVYKSDSNWADPQTPEQDFILDKKLAGVEEVGGQRVFPSDGRAETSGWSVSVVDLDEEFTAKVADSQGRIDIQGRLFRLQKRDNDGSWETWGTGRINDVSIGRGDVTTYSLEIFDELHRLRENDIFNTGNTTRLYPAGLDVVWRRFGPDGINQRVERKDFGVVDAFRDYNQEFINSNKIVLEYVDPVSPVTEEIIREARNDTNEDKLGTDDFQNLFKDLKFHDTALGTGDHKVVAFRGGNPNDPVAGLEGDDKKDNFLSFFVHWPDSPPSPGQVITGFLWFPDRNPSDNFPFHFGGQGGLSPGQVIENAIKGDYTEGSMTEILYDQDAIDKLKTGDLPKMAPRITTGTESIMSWLEENIFSPLGIVPFVDKNGRFAPKKVLTPDQNIVSDPSTLFTFDQENSGEEPSNWRVVGQDQITVVNVTDADISSAKDNLAIASFEGGEMGDGFDGIIVEETEKRFESDKFTRVGVKEQEYNFIHYYPNAGFSRSFIDVFAQNILDRYQDGPIRVETGGFTSAESLALGEHVVVDKSYLPNPQTQQRGGARLMQIVNRVYTPAGPNFELLDIGPDDQPLPKPSISASQNTNQPENAIDVTLDSLPSAAKGAQIQIAVADSKPATDSTEWEFARFMDTVGNTITIGSLPANKTVWVRARSTAAGRISSIYTSAISVSLGTLPGLSSLTVSDISGTEALLTWGNSDDGHAVEVLLGGAVEATLNPGAEKYRLEELESGTNYTPTVRLIDGFEGQGAEATLQSGGNGDGTFTTNGTSDKLTIPLGIDFVGGRKP